MVDNAAGHNWAANYAYVAPRLHVPKTVEEVQEIVSRSTQAKALGTRHCFNDIADTIGDLISTKHLRSIDVDVPRKQVTVGAGTKYGQLCVEMDRHGLGVPNLASLPHISVGGATATATHGSGVYNQSLSAAVSAIELVDGEGTVHRLSRGVDPDFPGMVVHLGALGLVARLTLDLVPAFSIAQRVYEGLAFQQALAQFDQIMSGAYSVSLFTHWRGAGFEQVWVKELVGEVVGSVAGPPAGIGIGDLLTALGARPASEPLHPIKGMPAEFCTPQLGVPGPSHERLAHFRREFLPSCGDELQSEYFVPIEFATGALEVVHKLADKIAPLLHVSEIRAVAADDLWLGPCNGHACVTIHFTWRKDRSAEVLALLPAIESALEPFDARPHWGKLFAMPTSRIRVLYPKVPEFKALRNRFDPNRKFANAYLERVL